MKALRVEDRGIICEPARYKIIKMVDTVEWEMGEYLSKKEIESILRRHGQNAVKIEIVPKKG